MRKIFALMVALCLLVVPCFVNAESNDITYDFGDFTMTFPSDAYGSIADEITDGVAFFMLYQHVDENVAFKPNLNVTWTKTYIPLDTVQPSDALAEIMTEAVAALEGQGVKASNATALDASMDTLNGKAALSAVYSMDVDYSGIGADLKMTLYCAQAIISEENLGTYTFTITTDDLTTCQPLMDIVNTVAWKK